MVDVERVDDGATEEGVAAPHTKGKFGMEQAEGVIEISLILIIASL